MNARYYDPDIGRFISRDPINIAGGLNLYRYVGNNPINHIDPLGLQEDIAALEAQVVEAFENANVKELTDIAETTGDNLAKRAIARLRTKVGDIIAKEVKGSVNQEFPKEYLEDTLEDLINEAKSGNAAARKALKLIKDNRFRKVVWGWTTF